MKRLHASAILFVMSCLLFSCQQTQEEDVRPQQPQQPVATDLPHFDETNSPMLSGDQLPQELKNALPLPEEVTDPNARSTNLSTSVGPWGGSGGTSFSATPPNGSRIHSMAIGVGSVWGFRVIDRFVVWYKTESGTIYKGVDAGSGAMDYIQYFSSGEYITRISGRAGTYVDQLNIYTNKKSFGYGGTGGSAFSASAGPNRQILGFYGREANYLDRIGFRIYSL